MRLWPQDIEVGRTLQVILKFQHLRGMSGRARLLYLVREA
jgi:hypothetical protein